MKHFLAILLFLIISPIFAAKEATINTTKAVVYADIDLTTPIGYVRIGKKLLVGDKALKRGTVYSTVVSGRVAYIEASDIIVKDDALSSNEGQKKIREHDVDELFKSDEDKLSENNFVVLTAGLFSLGSEWETLSNDYGETASSATHFGASVEHRPIKIPWAFSLGFTYYSNSQEQLSMKTLSIDFNGFYSLIFNELFSLDLTGTLSLSADIQFNDPNNNQDFNRGVFYGLGFGGQVRLFPASTWSFIGGAQIRKLFLHELDDFKAPSGDTQLGSIGGPYIYFGISYKL